MRSELHLSDMLDVVPSCLRAVGFLVILTALLSFSFTYLLEERQFRCGSSDNRAVLAGTQVQVGGAKPSRTSNLWSVSVGSTAAERRLSGVALRRGQTTTESGSESLPPTSLLRPVGVCSISVRQAEGGSEKSTTGLHFL